MSRFAAVITTVVCLLLAASWACADGAPDAPTLPVRYSVAPDKVRVVLDLPQETAYTDHSTPKAAIVSIATPLAQPIAPITLNDPIATGIILAPDADGQAVLTVTLAAARKCQIFTLPAEKDKPFRVVIDILKRFQTTESRKLSPAITYTRFEQQTDDRYMQAHFIEVNLRDRHTQCRVVTAQRDRETVAAMVTRTGAACGVNGGYFLQGTRPVGLLKAEGIVRSLPLWGRTAVAFAPTGPAFGNPSGCWQVTLPDGTTREVADWMNASILPTPPSARIIPGATLTQAPANPRGVTAIIRDSVVIARPSIVTLLQPGDFALHLTGDEAKALDAQLPVGAKVTVTPVLTPAEWKDYEQAVGAGPRLLQDGALTITAPAERIPPDILNGRPARTGIGATTDGRLVLVVVEAPGPFGGGATLAELAGLLKAHGACDAMNLDGGGSSCLALGPETVNYPPKAWVRPVACGILIYDDRLPSPGDTLAAITVNK
ncbi:MAG TPA: phosphodiester glycosidase family protein [Armatimonadota bacterium]|jgi:hypothetical protein